MLGTFKPVAFDRYGRRKSARVPRWLVLLLIGIGVGAAAVLYVQERHLPPRLSHDASTRLTQAYEKAEAERQRLSRELADTGRQLEAALGQQKTLEQQLGEARRSVDGLRADVATLVAALPPDPRGGAVAVRAARLRAADGALAYEILLTRDRTGERPLAGQLQLVVSGQAERGGETSVTLPPVAVSIGTHQSVSGEAPLPRGFA
ncbi:MAG: hypothetical protein MUC32_04120, partial [Burkholderiaceae bacterium]|nr:hypothetical protein [Burkholderiaceae bacterium]